MKNYLDFEKEIKELEAEVDNLKSPFGSEGISEVDTNKIKVTQHLLFSFWSLLCGRLSTHLTTKICLGVCQRPKTREKREREAKRMGEMHANSNSLPMLVFFLFLAACCFSA